MKDGRILSTSHAFYVQDQKSYSLGEFTWARLFPVGLSNAFSIKFQRYFHKLVRESCFYIFGAPFSYRPSEARLLSKEIFYRFVVIAERGSSDLSQNYKLLESYGIVPNPEKSVHLAAESWNFFSSLLSHYLSVSRDDETSLFEFFS